MQENGYYPVPIRFINMFGRVHTENKRHKLQVFRLPDGGLYVTHCEIYTWLSVNLYVKTLFDVTKTLLRLFSSNHGVW